MTSWNLSRLFWSVTADDFRTAVDTVKKSLERNSMTGWVVEIKCYDGIKDSITKLDRDLQAWLDERNAEKVFATVDSAKKLTDDLWLRSVFIEAVLRPENPENAPDYAFSVLEAKGLGRRTIGFYVQPDQIAKPALEATQSAFRRWLHNDGLWSNHNVTYG